MATLPITLIALVTLSVASSGEAAAADARAATQKVQAFYERTQDLKAHFVQTYTYAALGRTQVSKGELRVKKPGRIRWDYAEPSKKTIAVSGSRLVQYEPELNQAYVEEHFDATAMSAAVTFLLGKGKLEEEFVPSLGEDGALVLRPKTPDPRLESITLVVGTNGEVKSTRVVDGAGNVNQLALEDVSRNVKLKDSEFELKLPKDVRQLRAPGR